MSDYKHQCRYCAYCVVTADDIPICVNEKVQNQERGDYIPYKFKKPNKCPYWLFNKIAADFCDESKVYKPRKPSLFKQLKLFNMPTDRQRARCQ